jgi:uncharacterized protein
MELIDKNSMVFMKRTFYLEKIISNYRVHKVCGLIGPRQVGKTTLAKMYISKHVTQEVVYYDLENPIDLAKLKNPMLTLSRLKNKFIVIDEVQKLPNLFPILRVLVDDEKINQKYLILGSASRDLLKQSSETLAGRIGYIEIMPFSLEEVEDTNKLWIRGGLPISYLSINNKDSLFWRESYIRTFLERDIYNLGFNIPPEQLRRFWLMLSHFHGQIFNANEISKSLGISNHTARKYLDVLKGTFMVRILFPWFENLKKRQVKSPKIYFRDSGILHSLIGIKNYDELSNNPKLGSFWEGFALEEIIRQLNTTDEENYFWSTQQGAELDLLIVKGGKRIGFEFKFSDKPKITKSMMISSKDLKLDHLYLIFPGNDDFPLSDNITAYGLEKALPNNLFD